ncbi:MAG: glycosyltransferase family 2 protein [Flavobacteriales bacterium]|nr:glycosyltransferase family 2 protein [Flavobacteriales bacterium]
MKVNISAVIITFNEEKNIERCILSLKNVVDEIVVVDSFSKDKTKEICLTHGVVFIQHAFKGHIEQKNWAYTQAKNNHVLSLDADEALSEELKKSILAVKNNWKKDGYAFNRLTSYCGKWIKHCGWYPDIKLRLWDRRKGTWKGVNPHDCFEMEKGIKPIHLTGDLLHYSYYTIEEHIKQINYFTDIAAKAYVQKGAKPSLFKVFASAKFMFFKTYFLKLGILDGYYGWIISKNSAHATFLKYSKIRELQKEN